jgi:2-polyprenyl-6-methoxyphenol hydroxylase-like FAD-dependent oxidoreductase
MSLSQRPILIIGAGISGLACARILSFHRVPTVVFETFPKSRRQGYGITLRSWAYSPFLERLRISPTTFKAPTTTDAPIGGRGYISSTLVDAYTGKSLTHITPARSNSEVEVDFFRVNRFRLREYLANGLDVRYEHELISFESKADGLVAASFGNGETVEESILVGADGVFSKGI